MRKLIVVFTALTVLALPAVASADDHLFNGATSPGATHRGFTNPVAANPSGVSGAAAQPGTVPGLGNPNAGHEQGTPSFDPDVLAQRLADRAGVPAAPSNK